MFKKIIYQLLTNRHLKKRVEQPMADFHSAKSIAILCSELFENESNIRNIITELKAAGKEVHLMVFCHHQKKVVDWPHFHLTDITFSGQIRKEALNQFLSPAYDFAICYDHSRHFVIDYVFSQINSKCRIGLTAPGRERFFEMMVQSNDRDTPLSEVVLKYLKMIQPYGQQQI